MAEYCRQLSKIRVFHIFGPTYAKDNCLHFVLQNGILYANFCLVQYLCVMGDNTNTSLNKVVASRQGIVASWQGIVFIFWSYFI